MPPRLSTFIRVALAFTALASVAVGMTLVIVDERASERNDALFADTQFALRSSFGVFDDPAASQPLPDADGTDMSPNNETPTPRLEAVALLSIPKINVDVAAVSYIDYDDLKFAIGYMPESAAPNEPGITYFVGHRTGFGAPFRELDQLQPGDVFTVKNAAGIIEQYQVNFVEIRKPSDALPELANLTGRNNVLLVTCHPEFSTDLRLIVGASGE